MITLDHAHRIMRNGCIFLLIREGLGVGKIRPFSMNRKEEGGEKEFIDGPQNTTVFTPSVGDIASII